MISGTAGTWADPDRAARRGAFLASTVPAAGSGFADPVRELQRQDDRAALQLQRERSAERRRRSETTIGQDLERQRERNRAWRERNRPTHAEAEPA